MLVISRKLGQRLVISRDITVTVLDIAKGRIKLGVEAPHEVPVHREEVSHRMVARRPTLEGA